MAVFHLQIVTPDKYAFDGEAQSIRVRTKTGDAAIMAKHIDYTAPLDIGLCVLKTADGATRVGACNGGFISVSNGYVRLVAATFEWQEEIDRNRAERALASAQNDLKELHKDDQKYIRLMSKLRRAQTRLDAAQ